MSYLCDVGRYSYLSYQHFTFVNLTSFMATLPRMFFPFKSHTSLKGFCNLYNKLHRLPLGSARPQWMVMTSPQGQELLLSQYSLPVVVTMVFMDTIENFQPCQSLFLE